MSHAHEVLGVPRHATSSDIRRAFRRLVLELHPDRAGAEGEAKLLAAIAAYEELTGKVRPLPRRRRASQRPAARVFVRDRYNCGGCGDTFAIEGECPRCGLPLAETDCPRAPDRPEVDAYIARLSTPPSWLERQLEAHRERMPAVALGGCFVFGAFAMTIHPPIALMAVGYGLSLFAAEAWSEARAS